MNEFFNYILLILLMAFPTVEETLEQVFTGDDDDPLAVNMPATVNEDELLVMQVALNEKRNHNIPTGWTRIINYTGGSGGLMFFYKQADGTEGGTTVDVDLTSPSNAAVQVWRVSGWNSVEASSVTTANSSSPDPASLSPSWGAADTLWIAGCSYYVANPTFQITAYPSGYTNGTETSTEQSTSKDTTLGTARRENNTATEDPGAFTLNDPITWDAFTVAIEPGSKGSGGGTVEGSPSEMAVALSLDQFSGVITAVGTLGDMAVATSLDSFTGALNAVGSPSDMSVSVSLDTFAGILHAVGAPSEMSVSTLLDEMTISVVGSPSDMSIATALDVITGTVTFVGSPSEMNIATSLDQLAGTITAVGSLDDMNIATQLDQFEGRITAVGSLDEMSVATLLDQVTGGTQGEATKVSISANELYVIELSTKRLYKITLTEKELYTITLSDNEIID